MYRQGTVKTSAVRALSLLALTGASLSVLATAASAAATRPAASAPVGYSCSLAPYGPSLPPLNVAAALSATSNGSAVTVTLVTQPVQLPAATVAALPAVSYADVKGSAPDSGMASQAVSLTGHSQNQGTPAGSMTVLPAMTATGTVQAAATGMASVEVPPALTITLASATTRAPLTCATTSAVALQVAVTGNTAMAGAGQAYSCTVTVGTATSTRRVPMRLTATQPGIIGSQDAVALSAPASALGSAFPGNAVPMSVTGSAPLSGMYAGSIPMTGLADSGNGTFRLSGHWMPRVAGSMRVFAPHRFTARLRTRTTTVVVVACAAMAPATTSTQVMVKVAAGTAAASSAPAAPQAAPGAPNTGGGGSLHPANELPLVAGGAVAVVAGLAITGYALKRRQSLSE